MRLQTVSHFTKRPKADLLILPVWEEKENDLPDPFFSGILQKLCALKDFQGKEGETLFFYPEGQKEVRILWLGLGKREKNNLEKIRKAYGEAARRCLKKKILSANIWIFEKIEIFSESEFLTAALEGMLFANYEFHYATKEERKPSLLQELNFLTSIQAESIFSRSQKLAEALYFTRDLVNRNADDISPEKLAEIAQSLAKKHASLRTKVLHKKELTREKMGLLLAVGRASSKEPKLITITYMGNPKQKQKIALVGKGITYDTGGLSLKPTPSMLTMRGDMAGAACVMGVILAAALLKIPQNIVAVIPTAENSLGPDSYKLGDVYTSYGGKTVEITNTDAEGRLALADAISYTLKKESPTCLFTVATLTGGVVIALGEEITGFFTTSEKLCQSLESSSQATGEPAWRLPLYEPYQKMLRSEVADWKNSAGREASSMTAALFLKAFMDDKTPFTHLDIAGSAFFSKAVGYHPAQATGMPVRLLVHLLENFSL